jgi:hypothetical protein
MAAENVPQQLSHQQTRRHGFSRYRELGSRLNRLRTYFSRMFEPYLYTPEGFRVTKRRYVVKEDTVNFPVAEKRAITICNLFSNQHMSIDEIAKLLGTDRRTVIFALIQEGLIGDRRHSQQRDRRIE